MSIADLLVIGVVLTFLGFIVWANVYHRKQMLRERKAAAARSLQGTQKAPTADLGHRQRSNV